MTAAPLEVVAAVITRGDTRVLVAHRSMTPIGWEFPGGKVEPGETRPEALVREIREELGAGITVGPNLGRRFGTGGGRPLALSLYACVLADGEPRTGADHDKLRWVAAGALGELALLPLDAAFLDVVRQCYGD